MQSPLMMSRCGAASSSRSCAPARTRDVAAAAAAGPVGDAPAAVLQTRAFAQMAQPLALVAKADAKRVAVKQAPAPSTSAAPAPASPLAAPGPALALAGAAALAAYGVKRVFDTPSRTYNNNVGTEYDAWTDEGASAARRLRPPARRCAARPPAMPGCSRPPRHRCRHADARAAVRRRGVLMSRPRPAPAGPASLCPPFRCASHGQNHPQNTLKIPPIPSTNHPPGILEYYWGEHIHLGYYSDAERAAGYKKKGFIQARTAPRRSALFPLHRPAPCGSPPRAALLL